MLSVYNLPNSLPGESVVKIIHRDFYIMLKRLIVIFAILAIPLLFLAVIFYTQPDWLADEIGNPAIVLGLSAYYLLAWLFSFFLFLDYYLNVWIITSQRIIYIVQKGFFSRDISEQRLNRIQEATSKLEGIIPTIFNFGDVFVQTAVENENFIFDKVPDPEGIRSTITNLLQNKPKENVTNKLL
jgi:hypothetical protein